MRMFDRVPICVNASLGLNRHSSGMSYTRLEAYVADDHWHGIFPMGFRSGMVRTIHTGKDSVARCWTTDWSYARSWRRGDSQFVSRLGQASSRGV